MTRPGRAILAGAAILAASVLALGVSACSAVPGTGEADAPKSIAIRSYPGLPPAAPEMGQIGAEPMVMWVESGSVFAVTTWGSSSCPLVPTDVSGLAADAVGIHFEDSPEEVCTADMAPTTNEFTLPGTVTERPVLVMVTYESWEDIHTLVLD